MFILTPHAFMKLLLEAFKKTISIPIFRFLFKVKTPKLYVLNTLHAPSHPLRPFSLFLFKSSYNKHVNLILLNKVKKRPSLGRNLCKDVIKTNNHLLTLHIFECGWGIAIRGGESPNDS